MIDPFEGRMYIKNPPTSVKCNHPRDGWITGPQTATSPFEKLDKDFGARTQPADKGASNMPLVVIQDKRAGSDWNYDVSGGDLICLDGEIEILKFP
jgi:hypothetical protein